MPRNYRQIALAIVLALVFPLSTSAQTISDATSDSGAKSDGSTPILKPYVKLTPPPPDKKAVETNKQLDDAVKTILSDSPPDILRIRKDKKAAKRLANYHWLDKASDANPLLIEAITSHKAAAKILARHPRLAEVSESDHYVCRRITKWKSAARILAANSQVKEVAGFDPDGIYTAIKRDRKIIRILSKNPMFDQMIVDNPDLGRIIAKYM